MQVILGSHRSTAHRQLSDTQDYAMITPSRMLSYDLNSKVSASLSPDSKASVDEEMSMQPASSSSSAMDSAPFLAQTGRSSSSNGASAAQNNPSLPLQAKKRKSLQLRACDACAIRKVKCDQARPCSHCVSNQITCTLVRQRKKCGPKNLLKKTLNSISSVGVPDNQVAGLSKYFLSDIKIPELVELLQMFRQPTVLAYLAPLTVPSIILAFPKHIDFINDNSINDGRILVDPTDPIFISKISVIFTLILLHLENLIKLLSLNYKFPFQVRNLTYYKNLKHHLQTKLSETLSTLDRLLIFPSFSLQFKQQITYYNQAITSLHLFRYYQIASVNEQQKLIYLRKAITFFQLVSIPVGNKSDLSTTQLYELYETVFELERFNLLFQFNLVLKDSNLLLREWVLSSSLQVTNENENLMFQMLKVLNKYDLFNDKILDALSEYALVPSTSFRGEASIETDERYVPSINFELFKKELETVLAVKYNPCYRIMKNVILFKILVFHSRNVYFKVTDPLFEIVSGINADLNPSDSMVSLFLSNHQVLPHLLQLVRFYLAIEERSKGSSEFNANKQNLVELSQKIVTISAVGYCNVDNLIQSNRVLKQWYDTFQHEYQDHSSALPWKANNQTNKDANLYELLDELEISNLISNSHASPAVISSSAPITHSLEALPSRPMSVHSERNGLQGKAHDEYGTSQVVSAMSLGDEGHSNESSVAPSITIADFQPVPITGPAPPVITPATIKREEAPEINPLVISDSTKSLYNLFNQVQDDLATTTSSNSLSNLFQFGMNREWKPPTQEEIKNNKSGFLL